MGEKKTPPPAYSGGCWFKFEARTRRHPKTRRLARALYPGDPARVRLTISHLVYLWAGVAEFAQDGDLSDFETDEIEDFADWGGDPGAFVEAMVSTGFFDQTPGGLLVHNWIERAANFRAAHRKRAARAKKGQTPKNPAGGADAAETGTAAAETGTTEAETVRTRGEETEETEERESESAAGAAGGVPRFEEKNPGAGDLDPVAYVAAYNRGLRAHRAARVSRGLQPIPAREGAERAAPTLRDPAIRDFLGTPEWGAFRDPEIWGELFPVIARSWKTPERPPSEGYLLWALDRPAILAGWLAEAADRLARSRRSPAPAPTPPPASPALDSPAVTPALVRAAARGQIDAVVAELAGGMDGSRAAATQKRDGGDRG